MIFGRRFRPRGYESPDRPIGARELPEVPGGPAQGASAPGERAAFPHCDTRILHGPADQCQYCDQYPDWQKLRRMWGIAFTGHEPKTETIGEGEHSFTRKELPCPADFNRPPGSPSDHRQWHGNVAKGDE